MNHSIMERIKLAIFDLDGTLIDSLAELAAAANHVRTVYGLPVFTESEIRYMLGNGGERLVKKALPNVDAEELRKAQQIYLDYCGKNLLKSTRLFPGVSEVLQSLDENGVKMAILSNKHSNLSSEILNRFGIASFFSAILGPDSFPICKPSPEPVLKLMEDFNSSTVNSVVIGDSVSDIIAGKSAGAFTVGCSYGYCDAQELADADYRISSIWELLELPFFC